MGDERLILMAALMVTDELFDARADVDELLEQHRRAQIASGTTGHSQSLEADAGFAEPVKRQRFTKGSLNRKNRCQGPGFFASPTLILPMLRGSSGTI